MAATVVHSTLALLDPRNSRTRSVVPGIVVHVLNNSLSVWFTLNWPDVDHFAELTGQPAYTALLAGAAVLLVLALWQLTRHPRIADYRETASLHQTETDNPHNGLPS